MAEDKKKPTGPKMPMAVRFAIFMIFVTSFVFLPSTIVVSVCMLPTLVAAIVDQYPNKTAWLTVGSMNLAGTIPIWFTLWEQGHTIPVAFQLIVQPATLLVAYGASLVGWMIYYNVPPLIAAIVLSKNERRLKAIEKRQKELAKKWGEEVVAK